MEVTDQIKKFIKVIQVLQHGRTFTSFTDKLKQKALMASESGREQLNQFFSTYKSSKVAYEGFTFVKEVEAKDCDLIIEVEKNAGDR